MVHQLIRLAVADNHGLERTMKFFKLKRGSEPSSPSEQEQRERPPLHYFADESTLDSSLYTSGDRTASSSAAQASRGLVHDQRPKSAPRPSTAAASVLETSDIDERISAYHRAVDAHRARVASQEIMRVTPQQAVRSSTPESTQSALNDHRKPPERTLPLMERIERSRHRSTSLTRVRSDATPVASNRVPGTTPPSRKPRLEAISSRQSLSSASSGSATPPPPARQKAVETSFDSSNFSYIHSETGQGFEPSPTRRHSDHAAYRGPVDVDDDDNNTTVSLDLNIVSGINASDSQLMDQLDSPGILRLTKDGLKHHNRKTLLLDDGSLSKGSLGYDKFVKRSQKEKERWREIAEREDNLFDARIRVNIEKSRYPEEIEQPKKTGPRIRNPLNLCRKDEDVSDFSVAPLCGIDHLTKWEQPKKKEKKGALGRLRKKEENKMTMAEQLLEQERLAEKETERLRLIQEARERRRIEAKKREFLERERQKEATAAKKSADLMRPKPTLERDTTEKASHVRQSRSVSPPVIQLKPVVTPPPPTVSFGSFPAGPFGNMFGSINLTDPSCFIREVSTASSSNVSSLPPCVVCHTGERTHIATPCMHYSFCKECVDKLEREMPYTKCPVCQQMDVQFAPVSM